jgi:hypothetical protein
LAFVSLSDVGLQKAESLNISYAEKPAPMDKMMKDIESVTSKYSHIEISIELKKTP